MIVGHHFLLESANSWIWWASKRIWTKKNGISELAETNIDPEFHVRELIELNLR